LGGVGEKTQLNDRGFPEHGGAAVLNFSSTHFLECMPPTSREEILVNSTKIRYAAGTIPFQPGDPDRADILETGFARIYLSSS